MGFTGEGDELDVILFTKCIINYLFDLAIIFLLVINIIKHYTYVHYIHYTTLHIMQY